MSEAHSLGVLTTIFLILLVVAYFIPVSTKDGDWDFLGAWVMSFLLVIVIGLPREAWRGWRSSRQTHGRQA